jgi:methionine synthase II (cobalamin-independent)
MARRGAVSGDGEQMPRYPKYTTTVIGARSVQRWYEALDHLGDTQLGAGAVDVQAPNIESGELVADRIRAHGWLARAQTIITSSCGLHLPQHIAFGELRAMTEAKSILLNAN